MNTALAIKHFSDRKKPCLVLEQGNQCMVIGTIRNRVCEHLLREYWHGSCGTWGDMRNLFELQEGEVKEAIEMRKVDILDKIRTEIEETYMNITYQENKDRKATWGLRKALEIIDKYKAEKSEE